MITRIAAQPGTPVGTALIRAVDDPANRVIVLAPTADTALPLDRLTELFAPDYGIGAVVPQIRRPDGRLAEAGVVTVDGQRSSRHLLDPDPEAAATAADADGSAYPWIAFRRDVIAGAAVDPAASAAEAAELVLAAVTAAGLRTVYEPGWRVETTEASSVRPPAAAPAEASPQILVVVDFLPGLSFRAEDRFAEAIIADLADVAGARRVTVAALDGFRAAAPAAALRARGVRVVTGPHDWAGWFDRHWGRYDHVFVFGRTLTTALNTWLAASQPQAVRILCLDSLPFRAIDARRPITPADEQVGLQYFSDATAALARRWLSEANGVVCSRPADAAYVQAAAGGRAVTVVPPPLTVAPGPPDPAARLGVAVLATDGYDVTSGNEESVHTAVRVVVSALRERHPDMPVAVISDNPTPQLRHTIDEHGFDLVPSARTAEVLGRARVVLALHQFGTGGREAVLDALGSQTPFVASPFAADDLDLGPVRPHAVFGDPADIRYRVERLLYDDGYWSATAGMLAQVLDAYQPAARRDALRALLARTGFDAKANGPDWPAPATPVTATAPPVPAPPLPRPGARIEVSLGPVPRPEDFDIQGDERYRLWHERRGAGPATLDWLRRTVPELPLQPLISVVMPVYNTDPAVLAAAVDSVRDQAYDRWQLCLADDASTRPETVELLDRLAGDPQLRVVRLERNAGISEATNAALGVAEGDYVAFMDHDDLLKPHALAQVVRWINADPELDVIYSDEDKVDRSGHLGDPHLKPDWSPDLLMSMNYVSHLTVMRRSLIEAAGGLRRGFEGSQDYDLLLRVTEMTDRVAHIPEPLYSWRMVEGSAADEAEAKPYAADAAKRALADALERRNLPGWVEPTQFPTFYRTRYAIPGTPRVSVIIPTKDGIHLLEPCVKSVLERSTYSNFEIVVVDNQSTDGETLQFLARSPVRVVRYPHRFNYSRQLNLAAASVESDVLLFLNNDTEVITPDWIEALLEHAMRPEVGAVGGRLYYTDGKVQHEGILVGAAGGWAWNIDHGGYFARGDVVRNASAVTGACTMVRSTVYARLGGNDERLRIAYNDVDICLRARQAGFQVVYTPYAELYHHEGATRRGFEHNQEGPMLGERWRVLHSVDPYHSPLFLNDRTDTAFLLAL